MRVAADTSGTTGWSATDVPVEPSAASVGSAAPTVEPGTVAVVVDGLRGHGGAVVGGLVARLREHGLRPVVHAGAVGEVAGWDAAGLDLAGEGSALLSHVLPSGIRLAGVAAVAGVGGRLPTALPALWHELPRVVVGARVPGAASVVVEPARALAALVGHLVEVGARVPAFVGATGSATGSPVDFRAACARLDLAVDEARIVAADGGRVAGYRAASRLLRRAPDLDAIVVTDEEPALGVLDALAELGVDVPDRLRVAVVGDGPRAARARPPLTAVDPGARDEGRRAADVLAALVRGEPPGPESEPTPRVVVRASTVKRRPVTRGGGAPRAGGGDALEWTEARIGSPPEVLDRRWARSWLERLARQMRDGRLDPDWVRSWSRPVGSVEDVEDATRWLLSASGLVLDQVTLTRSTPDRSVDPGPGPAAEVHAEIVSRLTAMAAESARSAERAEVLAAQHLLAVGRSVDEAPSAAVALQVLAPELPSLGVRRLAMVVPDPHGGGAQPIVFAYEDGRVLTPAEAAAGAPAVESVAGTVRRGVRTDPVVVRALVAAGDAVGLLVYEPARTGASDLPQPWSPGAFPDDLAARLARALGRDVVRERLGTLRQGLTAASERLEAETARRVAAEEDLRRATRELSRSLTVDPLTGIHNRASLDDALEREWQAHAVSRRPLGVLMVDVDHFKAYNDRYGHVQGDVILREIARRLREAARRTSDLAARYGGEEFTVVLPDTDVTGARLVADTLLTRVREAAIAHEDVPGGRLTVSVGIAVWQVPSDWGPGDLIRAADEALYRAKADGRDRLAVAGSTAPGDSLALPMSGAMAVARRRAAPRH